MVGNIVVQKMIVDQLAKGIWLVVVVDSNELVHHLETVCHLLLLKTLLEIGLQHLVETVQALIANEKFLRLFRPQFCEGEDFLVAICDVLEIDIVHLRQKLRVMMSLKLTMMIMMMMRIVVVEVDVPPPPEPVPVVKRFT